MSTTSTAQDQIGAVILAAGASRRMGQPKLILPWGKTTVIGQIIEVLLASGLTEIRVVTGGNHAAVQDALIHYPVQAVFNANYANDDMVHSLRLGLVALKKEIQAALVVLGDQPQIQVETIQALLAAYPTTALPLIVPSYNQKRGHPWLVARSLWAELIALKPPATLRDFLNKNAEQIHYVRVATPGILKDLDTPDDYARERPANPS